MAGPASWRAAIAAFLVGLAASASAAEPDLERGRAVALGAGTQLAPRSACVTCHGMDGAGDSSGAFPRLTGQAAWYLYKQLKDYASGARPNDVMSPIAKTLSDADMQAVAGYYSTREAPHFPPPNAAPLQLQRGATMAAIGSTERGVPACVNCHGPNNAGLPPSFPYIAGQYAPYTRLQLELWKEGVRKNDPLGVMTQIARQLTPQDIEALAVYLAALRPEPTAARPAASAR